MCRFLIVNSKNKTAVNYYLSEFADMCKNNQRWQGDGWGLATWKNDEWAVHKSTNPIWEDRDLFNSFPPNKLFIVHARGSSFKKNRNNVAFNQPFVSNNHCFAFNGFINGVNLPFKVSGQIGSEKIFNLFLKNMNDQQSVAAALKQTQNLLSKNSKIVEAINIGICDMKKIHLLCFYDGDPNYFNIRYSESDDINLFSSESFGKYDWQTMKNDQILSFNIKS